MDFTALKTAIQNAIKLNGNEEITGDILQGVLLSMVSTLGDSAINDLVTAISNEATARQNGDSTLNGYITALQGAVNSINTAIGNGFVYAGIATPTTTPATGKVFYIALTAGTYTNFDNTEVSQGINILKYDGSDWSLDVVIALDNAPTPSSNNLVKSGGVFDKVMTDGSAFDISAHFASGGTLATYADLSAALTALNTLSASYKKGGMSIKFVQSSDNKYVQYRLMKNTWSVTESDWQSMNVDDEPTAGSNNLVKSDGVRCLMLRIAGIGAGGQAAGATNVGDFFFHSTQKILKRVTRTDPYSTVEEPTIIGSLYITPDDSMYSWNGTELRKLADVEAERLRAVGVETLLNNKVINLVGAGTSASDAGAINVGDYFYNTNENNIKVKTADGTEYVPFVDGNIYTLYGFVYYWDGTSLVKCYNDFIESVNNRKELKLASPNNHSASYSFSKGHFYRIEIIYPDGYNQGTQFTLRNGTTWVQVEIAPGYASRTVDFECYSNADNIIITAISGSLTQSSYTIYITDLSVGLIGDVYSNTKRLDAITKKEYVASFNGIPTDTQGIYRYIIPYHFKKNHTYRVSIEYPEGDTNASYFQIRNSSWQNIMNNLLAGTESRTGDFVCNADGGVAFGLALSAPTMASDYNISIEDVTVTQDEDVILGFDELPNYHKSSINTYINNLGSQITENDFSLSFITDLHMNDTFDKNVGGIYGLMCFNELTKSGLANLAVLGGDFADSKESGTQMNVADFWFAMNSCKRLTCDELSKRIMLRGNHEVASLISKKRFFQWADVVTNNIVRNASDTDGEYGYIDFADLKVRLIFLDASLLTYRGQSGDKQMAWLIGTALDFTGKTDFSAVVVGHEALYPFYYDNLPNEDWDNYPNYRKLFSAFHRGSSVTLNEELVDFTTQGAIPMVYIAGHSHQDGSYINASNDMDFLTITTMDSSTARDSRLSANIGTVNECAFDTYIINPANGTISIKRYGYGSDRSFTFD